MDKVLDFHITPHLQYSIEDVDEMLESNATRIYGAGSTYIPTWIETNRQQWYNYYNVNKPVWMPPDTEHRYWLFVSVLNIDQRFQKWLDMTGLRAHIIYQSPDWIANPLYPNSPPKLKLFFVSNPNFVG